MGARICHVEGKHLNLCISLQPKMYFFCDYFWSSMITPGKSRPPTWRHVFLSLEPIPEYYKFIYILFCLRATWGSSHGSLLQCQRIVLGYQESHFSIPLATPFYLGAGVGATPSDTHWHSGVTAPGLGNIMGRRWGSNSGPFWVAVCKANGVLLCYRSGPKPLHFIK